MNKKIILIIILLLFQLNIIFSQNINITEDRYVYDNANLFNSSEEIILESKLKNLSSQNLTEFIVVTINNLNETPIDIYSINLVQNSLGSNFNNGVLLLISKEDKEYRLEIGRGLEEYLNDGKVGRITRETLSPNFKKEKYFIGVNLVINKIYEEIKDAKFSIDSNSKPNKFNNSYFFIIIIFIVYLILLKRNKNKLNKDNSNKIKRNNSKVIKESENDLKIKKTKKINKREGKFAGGGASGKW